MVLAWHSGLRGRARTSRPSVRIMIKKGVIKNGTQAYGVELGVVDPVSG